MFNEGASSSYAIIVSGGLVLTAIDKYLGTVIDFFKKLVTSI